MKEGKIDLRDKRINVKSVGLTDASMLDASVVNEMKQIDLGKVKVLPKDSVMVDDIDVYNIPDDKDIVLEKEDKQMYAIGRKVAREDLGYKVSSRIEESDDEEAKLTEEE